MMTEGTNLLVLTILPSWAPLGGPWHQKAEKYPISWSL